MGTNHKEKIFTIAIPILGLALGFIIAHSSLSVFIATMIVLTLSVLVRFFLSRKFSDTLMVLLLSCAIGFIATLIMGDRDIPNTLHVPETNNVSSVVDTTVDAAVSDDVQPGRVTVFTPAPTPEVTQPGTVVVFEPAPTVNTDNLKQQIAEQQDRISALEEELKRLTATPTPTPTPTDSPTPTPTPTESPTAPPVDTESTETVKALQEHIQALEGRIWALEHVAPTPTPTVTAEATTGNTNTPTP